MHAAGASPPPRPRRLSGLLLLGLLGALGPASAHAGDSPPDAVRHYHVAAGRLDDALRAFTHASGIQLLYAPALTRDRSSHLLEGDVTAAQGLAILLQNSGLQAEEVADQTYVLRATVAPHPTPTPAARRPAAPALPPIPVDDLPVALVPVEVTGTHLRRTAVETAAPLTVIDRSQIERSGYQTLYELLRAQPGVRVNNAPVALGDNALFQANGLSGATGAAAVDLHGLGATATLFLVDGQRMAGYGLAQGEFSLVNDLESIPLALVERVEVLRDGASAIYGSDAMAGVINIILRKHIDGLALDVDGGLSSHGDAGEHRATASIGKHLRGGGNLMLSADYLDRSPLLGRQRAWARNATDGGDGYYYFDGGTIGYEGGNGCVQSTLDGPCKDSTAAQTTLQTALDSRSLLAHVDQPVGTLVAYADLRWNMLRQRQQTGPATEQLLVRDPSLPDGHRVITYAFDDVGPIRDSTKSRSTQWDVGLRGTPGAWAWDVRADSQRNAGTDRVQGLLRTGVLDRALADGSYRPGSDTNSPALLAALSPVLTRTGKTSQTGVSARADGPVAHWTHGTVSLAAGVEGYRERLDDQPDPRLISNDVFQFQSPYVRRGNRWISAGYVEVEAPLGRRITANAAARADHSAGFGWALSPRIGFKWDLADSLALRGTLARGYRAPTLPELERPQALLPTGVQVEVPDSLLPCAGATPSGEGYSLCTLRLDSVSNPDLQPERSRSLTLGVVLAPTPSLGIALDAYQVRREHEIRPLPVDYALDHPGAYPELFQRDADGVLYAFDQQLVNLGHTFVRSFDLDVHYRLDTARMGRFDLNLGIDWLATLRRQIQPDTPEDEYAGYANQPRATALAGLTWAGDAWVAGANVRFTGHYRYASSAHGVFACPDAQRQAGHCDTPAFAVLDLDLEYRGLPRWRIGLNVHNALDHAPVYYARPSLGYSPFDDVVGRYVLLSLRYRQ